MSTAKLTCEWVDSLQSIDPREWNALVGDGSPFLEWEWLRSMELASCVSPSEGWQPVHLLARRGSRLVGAAPLYLKGHSYGEFVFDHAWADAAGRMGLRYYPKLMGVTPFTPATGYRFLMHPQEEPGALMTGMTQAIDTFARNNRILSASFLYVAPRERERFQAQDCLERITHNYQWVNGGYRDFDEYLQRFNANQRRNIRRERAALEREGLTFATYTGDSIRADLFGLMYRLYDDTCSKFMWSSKYLNRRFFQLIAECFAHRTVFIAAHKQADILAMSFNICKGSHLYGRYWGCTEEVKFLHFSTCYYQPVEAAIQMGLKVFDPGAGGQFKMRRGFAATPNYSLHRIYHPRFRQILEDHLKQANRATLEGIDDLNNDLPMKELPESAIEI
ncbi:MAG: GNAT family N-acetyltransferase [Aphanocapsa lilacina HA4352-LM1]|jgi:predicted N-acyltransferase|nr:GNAT family N-acetyltransferase [Aphanocapsa lilacina HA4352-LM1]